jgi:ribonuclease Z
MKTEIFSKGLYSTYLYVKEVNSCFDCGEGMTTHLGPRCFGIRKLFVSHGHHDHISGISSLIGARCVARGDNYAPLEIYYPEGCHEIHELKAYIEKTKTPTFELTWCPIKPGENIALENPNRLVRAFKVEHTSNSLGFSILEKRKKVKKEFTNLPPQEFQRLKMENKKVTDDYFANLWSYTGDASYVNADDIENADWLFCDTTFLKEEDRKERTHYSVKEALELAKKANVKRFVGMHLSPRYTNKDRKEYQTWVQKEFAKSLLLPFTKPSIIDSNTEISKTRNEERVIVL